METSYQGVQFTSEQQGILSSDLAAIDFAINSVNNAQAGYNSAKANYDSEYSRSCGERKVPNITSYDNCMKSRQDNMAYYSQQMGQYEGMLNAANASLAIARQNYNDDLASIQNSIKLGIQASIATSTASAQAAQNIVSIQQNDPALLSEKLKLQATLDSQKREQTVKIVGFIVIATVVVFVGWYVIKKLL